MVTPFALPMALWRLNTQMATMWAEAGLVIGLRVMGLTGVIQARPGETQRMVAEKPIAVQRAMLAAATAAVSGKSPLEVQSAALRPIRKRTRANSRRLTTAPRTRRNRKLPK